MVLIRMVLGSVMVVVVKQLGDGDGGNGGLEKICASWLVLVVVGGDGDVICARMKYGEAQQRRCGGSRQSVRAANSSLVVFGLSDEATNNET